MDEKRMGEIALVLLKDQSRQEGIRLAGIRRKLGNTARRTGIPISEIEEFVRVAISDMVEESLSR